jgi:hypothetical protein
MEIIKYAIKDKTTGKLMGFSTRSNVDGEFCTDIAFSLEKGHEDNVWLANTHQEAENARTIDTKWYNACYSTPENYYADKKYKDNFEVVEVRLNY